MNRKTRMTSTSIQLSASQFNCADEILSKYPEYNNSLAALMRDAFDFFVQNNFKEFIEEFTNEPV